MNTEQVSLTRDSETDMLFSEICFGTPIEANDATDVIEGIERAIELGSRPVFLEGLSARLTELGTPCTVSDSDVMLTEVKRRFKEILRTDFPKAVGNWICGTVPGLTNRQNNYDLCYALEMDYKQTTAFFIKNFLTIPFNCKSKIDAIYLYCFYHNKPYSTVKKMLDESKCFVPQENAHTQTSQIRDYIFKTDDDDKFLQYLSSHCYDNEQQFQVARKKINDEIEIVKDIIMSNGKVEKSDMLVRDRLNSKTIFELLGQTYQHSGRKVKDRKLPKQFTESLPNDVTLGKIINGDSVTYELLRKTLMLIKLYTFYDGADNIDEQTIRDNILDFHAALNKDLYECGFAPIYERHPFDCLILYCANSVDPVETLHCINEH